MGIGRLEFLRLSGLALAGLAVHPLQAVATNENIYVNRKLGILFHKPDGWGFIHVKEFGRLKNEQLLPNGLDEFKEEIWNDLGSPICIATKYSDDRPEHIGVFSPTITLQITPKSELEADGIHSFEEVMELSAHGVSMLLKDFRVLKRHAPQVINGSVFHEFDCEYLFEHVEIDGPLKVELKSLKAEHNGFYYDFNCHQSLAQNQIAENEFRKFKETIQLL